VASHDAGFIRRVKRLRNYGSEIKYRFDERGVNSRLDEMQAAFMRAKLPTLDQQLAARRRIAARYLAGLHGLDIILPQVANWAEPAWHLFVIRVAARDTFITGLAAAGIGAQVHYPHPPHLEPAYAGMALDRSKVATSEAVAESVVSLPLWPELTEPMIDHVIATVRRLRPLAARPA
jgi:dTDP-4-amino-4,6-dideoxygalactose transaminase